MRFFGIIFNLVGVGLAGVSARAISDPASRIGWARWYDDPWGGGLLLGGVLVLAGTSILVMRRFLAPEAEAIFTRLLVAFFVAVVPFSLFMPYEGTIMCADGARGGFCRDVEWSTITGLTFEGSPTYWLALVVAAVAAIGAWVVTRRIQALAARRPDRVLTGQS